MGRLRVGSHEYNEHTLQYNNDLPISHNDVGSLDWLENVLHVGPVDDVTGASAWDVATVQLQQLKLVYHKSQYSMYDLVM